MYDHEVSGDFYRQLAGPVVSLAHKLRFRKVISYELTGEHSCDDRHCTHYRGMLFRLDDGSSCHVAAGDQIARAAICFGVLKHDMGMSWNRIMIRGEFARIAAVYWVASQQRWKDLAEDFVPYLIAAIKRDEYLERGNEETTTKRRRV